MKVCATNGHHQLLHRPRLEVDAWKLDSNERYTAEAGHEHLKPLLEAIWHEPACQEAIRTALRTPTKHGNISAQKFLKERLRDYTMLVTYSIRLSPVCSHIDYVLTESAILCFVA